MAEILSALQAVKPNAGSVFNAALGLVSPTGEPQKGYMWEVHIDMPKGVQTYAPKNMSSHYNQALMYYAQSVSIPDFSVESIEDNYLGEKYYHAGKQTGGKTTTITFWDDQSLTVYAYLKNWANLLHAGSEFGGEGRQISKHNYQRTIHTQLKDTTDFIVNLEVQFIGAFCNSITEVQQSYDSSDMLKVTAAFTFDDVVFGAFQASSTSYVQGGLQPAPSASEISTEGLA